LTPLPRAALKSWIAPAIEPWSVSETAAISSSAARATRSGIRHAPSRIEYSEWTWRWTKGAGLFGVDVPRPGAMSGGSVWQSGPTFFARARTELRIEREESTRGSA
jgi:hypothetical protein